MNNYFGEILESSLNVWTAQSWKWDKAPQFGDLVIVQSNGRKLFAIVYQTTTASIDPSRQAFAYQKTEQELLEEQPQIFEFLRTVFYCACIGYQENNKLFYQFAPEPPKIHSFVSQASLTDYELFFAKDHYLNVLFGMASCLSNLDELLLAILKKLSSMEFLNQNKLLEFTQSYSLLTGNDYRRLKLFLQRVSTIVSL